MVRMQSIKKRKYLIYDYVPDRSMYMNRYCKYHDLR